MEEIITTPAPEYGDLYLKFPDEAAASAALEGYEGSVDVIGVMYEPVSSLDAENGAAAVVIPGWHVNTRGPMPDTLTPFAVIPTNPRRTWA